MSRTAATPDVVVVGAGPNGLTAAAVCAAAGLSVVVLEQSARIGGGCRTEELTLPGFAHDVCSAIHPMAAASPIFERLRLTDHGLEWMAAPAALAHPLDDGRTAVLSRGLGDLRSALGSDGRAWARLVRPFVERAGELFPGILRPVRWPPAPWLMARFARHALCSCAGIVRLFEHPPARALFAGNAAHAFTRLDAPGSAAIGLALTIAAHAVDWPWPRGGSQQITDALAARIRAAGGEIHTGADVQSSGDVPAARAVLLDVTPRQLLAITGSTFPASYRRRLELFRYGAAAFKIDYALSTPIPWRSAACTTAGTVHVGGTYEEIARAAADTNAGRVPDAPFVLVAQHSLFDGSRAPAGMHTGWTYCHVPHKCTVDMTERIERQIERFAPGFRDTILARHVMPPAALETRNPNLVGGDINGGANTLGQVIWRPVPRWNPYATPDPRLFLCSSSTPPGGGVHGMCGYWAARTALRRVFGKRVPSELEI